MDDKKGRIGAGMIKGALISLIFLTVFLSIIPSLITTSATAVSDLAQNYTDLSDEIGSGASSLGSNIDDCI